MAGNDVYLLNKMLSWCSPTRVPFHIWIVVLLFSASLSSHDHVLWALSHERRTCTSPSRQLDWREFHSCISFLTLRLKPLSFGGLSWDGCRSYVISFLWAYQSPSLFLPSCILNHFLLSIPPSSWALIFIPSCWCLYSRILFFLIFVLHYRIPSMTPKQKLCKHKSCVCGYIRHFQGRIREKWSCWSSHTNTTLQMWGHRSK